MSYLDEAAQDMAESFKRIFITAFGHGYDFGCESKEGELKRLRADNAKLRELVLCLLTCHSDDSSACDKCPVNGGHGILGFEDFCDSMLDRMRELGVEVNDG